MARGGSFVNKSHRHPRAAVAQTLGFPLQRSTRSAIWAIAALLLTSLWLSATAHASAPRQRQNAKTPAKSITIDVVDADIRNILRLFSDVGGLNFVVDDTVTGNVTIKLRNVRWDKALKVILKTKGLGMEKDDNIVRIAPQAQLDKERSNQLDREVSCLRNARLQTRVLPVKYGDAQAMAQLVKGTLTERGSVSVDVRTNTLIVRDVNCRRRP